MLTILYTGDVSTVMSYKTCDYKTQSIATCMQIDLMLSTLGAPPYY